MGCNQILDRYIEQLIETSTPQAPAWNIEKLRAGKENTWNYIDGCMIKALIELYEITGEQRYLTFADDYIDFFVQDDGTIKHYDPQEYNLDNVNAGKTLYKLYDLVGKPKYRAAMDTIVPAQQRALAERGHLWAFAADEFYCNAYGDELLENLPPTEHYGDFGMFEDGVGIIRSFVDDWEAAEAAGLDAQAAQALQQAGMRVRYIAGMATPHFFRPLFSRGPLAGVVEPLFVENRFFGGNVDVTGLLCSCDIADAIRADAAEHPGWTYVVPKVIFNDDGVTLDDATLEDMGKAAGAPVSVVSCNATGFLPELVELAHA